MSIFNKRNVDHFVGSAVKNKPDWYISTFDVLSSLAVSNSDKDHLDRIDKLIRSSIDRKDYNAFLNPFNFKEDRNKRLPGEVRNFDIILSNVRKFIGEYVTSYQEFHVISSLPDEDNEMLDAINDMAYELLSKKALAQIRGEMGAESDANIDVANEINTFKLRYKDLRSLNAHDMLEYIRSNTNDAYLYAKAYTNWILYGRYFILHGLEDNDIQKEVLNVLNCYPIYNDEDFVEDYDGFYYTSNKSIQQIIANYHNYLDEKDLGYLKILQQNSNGTVANDVPIILLGPNKNVEQAFGNDTDTTAFAKNLGDIETGCLYYKGFKEVRIVKSVDILGNEFETEVDINYQLDPSIGDVESHIEYYPTVYVQYRFGSKHKGVYTKPIEYPVQRHLINNARVVKLPITGKVGIFPFFPNHSIPNVLYPFQVTVNLLHLIRERAILTSKGRIGIIPKELLGSEDADQEGQIYNMLVSKTLFADTENITNLATVIQAVREINLSDSEYITLLDNLIANTVELANNTIDMNRQRAGNTYASDGKGVNEEAVARVSMGSALINIVFDISRCRDYQADIDFSKVAWVDGKKGKYVTTDKQIKFFEVNSIAHPETEYGVFVTNSVEYSMQKKAIKEYAFSLGQNGTMGEDVMMDIVTNNGISKLKEIVLLAKTARDKKESDQFKQQQETQKYVSDQAAAVEQARMDHERWKESNKSMTDLLVKEVDIELKRMDNAQQDKNNQVMENINRYKQSLQTLMSVGKKNN